MLAHASPAAVALPRGGVAEAAPSAAPRARPAAAPVSRRQVAGALGALFLAGCSAAGPARAYGGSGNLRATDAGSGNPRYDDLIAASKAKGVPQLDIEAYKKQQGLGGKEEPKRLVCSTGREKACQ